MTTILIVDDEFDMLSAIQGALEDEGYQVVAKSSGPEALHYLGDRRPDLLLMDVMMPVLSGLEVLQRVRRMEGMQDLPVIMMSAVELPAKTPERSWDSFLKKPFSLDRLARCVAGTLQACAGRSASATG